MLDSQGGVTHYVQTKSGNAGKDKMQAKKDAWLESNRGINITYVFDGD
ncbi:hypothetical protein Sviol_43740 [Streptomyces violascens]|uniref:Uncharacterized protein n=1 Tax=Streptomyces violascens TaxID=67381 RepID=A0ABQ3QRR3_9ACTN|nr:hypothetical protein Sviol_43740 [Streptomyces violascens]